MFVSSKRGASHVEFIISLAMFLVFVSAALFFFTPKISTVSLDELAKDNFVNIEDALKTEVQKYGVKINNQNQEIMAIELKNSIGNERIENLNGQRLESGKQGDIIFFRQDEEEFIYIFLSENFLGGSLSGNPNQNLEKYEMASFIIEKPLSIKKAIDMKNLYEEDYNSLKNIIGIPSRIDFGFSVLIQEQEIKADLGNSLGKEIHSVTKRLEIMKEDGSREFGTLTVRIWE